MIWKDYVHSFLKSQDEKALKIGLRQEWFNVYPEEKIDIYNFLYFAKLHKLFLYFFAIDLQSQAPNLPWGHFLKILEIQKLPIPPQQFREMEMAARKQRAIGQTAANPAELFSALRKRESQSLVEKALRRKQELLSSARIAEAEGLLEQHQAYMKELGRVFPKEYGQATFTSEVEKKRAEQIVERVSRKRRRTPGGENSRQEAIDPATFQDLAEQAWQFVQSGDGRASDFAYLFRALGAIRPALEFVEQSEAANQRDWRLLDFLFDGKQHLALLDHCSLLKQKYRDQPDALFSISYVEAIAYWELGEKDVAIRLMEQISLMRPDFKSANEILRQWQGESIE